jgi:IclR family transcriptional regulator, KDG regulon repressor
MNQKPAAVQSIFRAAQILNCIGNRINSMSEIAAESNLSNSTVHRLLQALEDSDMVIQDPVNRKYYFGNLITKLIAEIQIPHQYLITLIKEPISSLAEETGESVSLAVLVGQQYNVLYEIPSKHKLRVVEGNKNNVEPLQPFNAASMVLLAQLEDKELELRIRNMELTSVIKDREDYLRRLRLIRNHGYAMNDDDTVSGSVFISVPVRGYIQPAVLTICGPLKRMQSKKTRYKTRLSESADFISKRLQETIRAKSKNA